MYYTRSRAAKEYRSAGVLPFAVSEGQVLALLGAELARPGSAYMYRDFGGARESADAGPAATAARECAEETLGMLWGSSVDQAGVEAAAEAMHQQLSDPGRSVCVVHALQRGKYYMFVTQAAFVSPLMFRMAREQNAVTQAVACAEKSAFAWVPLKALMQCVAVARPRYVLEAPSAVCEGPGTPTACSRGLRRFLLHPRFARSLRSAQHLGLPQLVARAHSLPIPAPPPLPPAVAAAVEILEAGACGEDQQRLRQQRRQRQEQQEEEQEEELELVEEGAEGADPAIGACDHTKGVGWWLQQAELAALLYAWEEDGGRCSDGMAEPATDPTANSPQAGMPAPAAAPAAAAAAAAAAPCEPATVMAGLAAAAARWRQQAMPQGLSQQQLTPSSSSLASSLRESKIAAEAAATAEVVDQISQNTKRGRKRRRRHKRRRRQQQQQGQQHGEGQGQGQHQQHHHHQPSAQPHIGPPDRRRLRLSMSVLA